MKLNKNEKTAANTVELEIFIEPEQMREAVSKVFRREGKKYNVPGFRKGKAPRNLIEKIYGEDVFSLDAVNDLFPDVFDEAVKQAGLEPVGQPKVELEELSAANGSVLKVTVTTKPELKIGKYTGLKAERPPARVDEARVDEEIDRMRQRNARIITREGAAEDGDIANIDYEGFVDGTPFDGGKDEGHKLNLGSGSFIEGFEAQVVGHKAGDEFEVKVTFPQEYHAENLAGKDAVFKVKLNEVQCRELPELDDEFAKDVSEYDTLDELKASIRANMQKELDEQADQELENRLVEQIVDTIEGEIPDAMYETRMDDMVRDFAFRLENQGLNLKTYLQYTGMSPEDFRNGFREQAEKQVKMRLALETVVRLEGIVAGEDDIAREVERIAEKYSMEAEKVRELMPTEEIAKDLAVNKAIELVKSKATITEEKPKKEPVAKKAQDNAAEGGDKKPAAKKAPAKKTAAKKADDETDETAVK